MSTVAEQIKWLTETYKPDDHIACIIWCEEDVLEMAKDQGRKVTRKDAQDILDKIERQHDAEGGVNWETISYHLESYPDEEEGEKNGSNTGKQGKTG